MLNEIEKGQLASETVQCFTGLKGSLSNFPGLIKKVIEERVWERRSYHGRLIELPNLRALITEKPIQGWGQDPKKIEAVIKDDPEALALFREAMKESHGGDRKSDAIKDNNVILDTPQGNSRAYSIARVQKECDPETVAQVMAGNISPNKALVKAGIRKNRQVYIPSDPAKVLPKLASVFGEEFVEALLLANDEA